MTDREWELMRRRKMAERVVRRRESLRRRDIRERGWRGLLLDVLECAAVFAGAAAVLAVAWACLAATPAQSSAEADWCRAEAAK